MRSDRSLTRAHTHTHLDKLGNSGWHRRNILPSIFVHCTHSMPWVNTHTNSPSLSPPPSLSLSPPLLSLSPLRLRNMRATCSCSPRTKRQQRNACDDICMCIHVCRMTRNTFYSKEHILYMHVYQRVSDDTNMCRHTSHHQTYYVTSSVCINVYQMTPTGVQIPVHTTAA